MLYNECPIISKLNRQSAPLIAKVKIDAFTEMVTKNFDYDFNGISEFYPYDFPQLPDFSICCIVGASGSGKSTMLKTEKLNKYSFATSKFNEQAIVSNFSNPQEACEKLSAVGLNSLPVWCRPRNVLSIGEGFRADVALNLKDYTIFDEFTSTIDRNVAKSTCNGLQNYIRKNNLTNLIFCSCHKDFIPYLKPDIVIDLDDQCIYDCRNADLGEALPYTSIRQATEMCGEYLGSITI